MRLLMAAEQFPHDLEYWVIFYKILFFKHQNAVILKSWIVCAPKQSYWSTMLLVWKLCDYCLHRGSFLLKYIMNSRLYTWLELLLRRLLIQIHCIHGLLYTKNIQDIFLCWLDVELSNCWHYDKIGYFVSWFFLVQSR